MTQLRKMMLEELQRRNYSNGTIRHHLRAVEEFANHYGKSPDKLGLNELRSYQAYLLKERKLAVGTVVNHVAGLRFFFVRTLKRHKTSPPVKYIFCTPKLAAASRWGRNSAPAICSKRLFNGDDAV